jgi:hypothetical protein
MLVEVTSFTPPRSIETAPPSNFTKESESTVTLEPEELIFRAELEFVWTTSPGKIAEERSTAAPFTQAVPYGRAIPTPEPAAIREAGTKTIIIQQIIIQQIVPQRRPRTLFIFIVGSRAEKQSR